MRTHACAPTHKSTHTHTHTHTVQTHKYNIIYTHMYEPQFQSRRLGYRLLGRADSPSHQFPASIWSIPVSRERRPLNVSKQTDTLYSLGWLHTVHVPVYTHT